MQKPGITLLAILVIIGAIISVGAYYYYSKAPSQPNETSGEKKETSSTAQNNLQSTSTPDARTPTSPKTTAPKPTPPPSKSTAPTPPSDITNKGPALVTSILPQAEVGKLYNAFVLASGGGKKYTWKIESGALPQGLRGNPSIDCSTLKDTECKSAYEITGIPSHTGSYFVRLAVSDGIYAVHRDFTLIVNPSAKPTITTPSLPNAILHVPYDAQIAAYGGTGGYTWSVLGGNLPPGLNLTNGSCSGTGLCQAPAKLSGTPSGTGTYTFVIVVSSGIESVAKEFTISTKQQ